LWGNNEINGNNASDFINIVTAGSERMRIDSSGNVGIGLINPTAKLHVNTNSTGRSNVYFSNFDTSSGISSQEVAIGFQFNRSGGGINVSAARVVAGKEREWVGAASNQDGFLAFETCLNESVSEKMRITSSGNVGIGTSSPSEKLEVNGNILISNNNGLKIKDTSGAKEILNVDNFNQTILKNANDTRDIIVRNAANADIVRFRPNGGIAIGGSGDANTLDDYEEGTHTPTVTPETSGTLAFGTGSTVMSYIKIGNRVFVNGYLLFSTVSSAVGNSFSITLPFAIKTGLSSDSEWGGGGINFYDISTTTSYVKPFIFSAGNSFFTVYMNLATELSANDRISFSFSYQSA